MFQCGSAYAISFMKGHDAEVFFTSGSKYRPCLTLAKELGNCLPDVKFLQWPHCTKTENKTRETLQPLICLLPVSQ